MLPTFPPRFTLFAFFHRILDIFNMGPCGPVQVKDAPGSSEVECVVGTTEVTQHQWKAGTRTAPSATAASPATAVGQCPAGPGTEVRTG